MNKTDNIHPHPHPPHLRVPHHTPKPIPGPIPRAERAGVYARVWIHVVVEYKAECGGCVGCWVEFVLRGRGVFVVDDIGCRY